MTDKVKLESKVPDNRIVEYNGVNIEIKPLIGIVEQGFLINKYLEIYFNKSKTAIVGLSEYDYLGAEFTLKDYIFQINTNIDTANLDNDFYCDPDLWEAITFKIIDYEKFRRDLDFIVEEIKEQKFLNNQLGKVLSGLLDKLNNILSNITPEEIEKLQKETGQLAEKLQSVSVIGDKIPAPALEGKG